MINWAQLKQLEEDLGPGDTADVISLFLTEVEEAIQELYAIPPDDGPKIAATLHFLKGCASNLGFEAFADNCARGEKQAENGQVADVSVAVVDQIYRGSKLLLLKEFTANLSAEC
ncbi:Hpt domain-containing protein [Neptunicoccus cionae]|uniref:Nickel transporter n=1 Tax=Neptunicoccus cionae TaxID=2035344 RepID=A0A916QYD2_9RHOB|nr:Hpt domain-containing protein [Amylibacter cionae]GGA17983.1 nickel transporter [Amylibacter cionae]